MHHAVMYNRTHNILYSLFTYLLPFICQSPINTTPCLKKTAQHCFVRTSSNFHQFC